MISKSTKSLLHELDNIFLNRNKHSIIESRASHVISSAIHLLELMKENYSPEEYDELSKRLILSIKNQDPRKFDRGIKRLKENDNG